MAQDDEFIVQDLARTQAADDGGHAVLDVAVETRLRPVGLVAHDDGLRRGAGQLQVLRLAAKVGEGGAQCVERGLARKLDGDGFEMAVERWHTVAVCAQPESGRLDVAVAE